MTAKARTLFTLGHSNRSLADFVGLAHAGGVRTVVDVRRFPASRRHPWFDRAPLTEALAEAGLGYRWLEDLGGRRPEPPPALAPLVSALEPPWDAYAAWARGDAFADALSALLDMARVQGPLGLTCAERAPEHCHRRLLSDVLVLKGWSVVHLVADDERREHVPHPLATLVEGRLAYPPRQGLLFE